ncbi:NUDIX domain-containing protein [Micromonospora sp. NBC_01739]|uniref:NUDIX domain-containing protein n=1 Tax=Micromonospora sp. NBC_01739 TaxID=2975985 RepID=UPI002E12EAC3|nr:NUDIX domain-containing protein [Micromonospora sp. NBC_01739]
MLVAVSAVAALGLTIVPWLPNKHGATKRHNHRTTPKLSACRCSPLVRENLAYGILLQPGGHLEPTDSTLISAAVRELVEETGVDPSGLVPASPMPVYVEYGRVPARPAKDEPEHFHLDFGYSFLTTQADVGRIQESEVGGAMWYSLSVAERLVGPRIARAMTALT